MRCGAAAQAFGMMGWRVGYIAYQDRNGLGDQLLKVQDTIAVRPLPDHLPAPEPGWMSTHATVRADLQG